MRVYDPGMLGLQIAKRSGRELMVFCPYHGDSVASAEYNIDKEVFYCFGCGASKTAKQISNDFGGPLVKIDSKSFLYWSPSEGETLNWRSMLTSPKAGSNEYLRSRKVSSFSSDIFGIRELKDGIGFPLVNKFDDCIGMQVRFYKRKPKYMFFGNKPICHPIWRMTSRDDTFLTEGIFGAIRGQEAGLNTVAILGASSIGSKAEELKAMSSGNLYTMMDMDQAGLIAAGKGVLHGIPAIITSKGSPDPDEKSSTEWLDIAGNLDVFSTTNVMDVIGMADNPDFVQMILEKYWRKLQRRN